MGLETQSSNISAPCRVAGKLDMLIGENVERSVVKSRHQRGILSPLMCYLVVSELTEGLDGNGCFTLGGGTSYPNQWKIPTYCLRASSGGFEYGTTVV
jgi:hypothetical protein